MGKKGRGGVKKTRLSTAKFVSDLLTASDAGLAGLTWAVVRPGLLKTGLLH